jgi:RNA polymerase sigma-70 factor (ECF subfamily)
MVSRAEVFGRNRLLLFSIAYRMTGSLMEDAVREAYLRWQQAYEDEVRSPSSYLSTVVTRLCIDRLRSARVRRELYVSPWLPEHAEREEDPG